MFQNFYNPNSGDSNQDQRRKECEKLIQLFEETMEKGKRRDTIGSPLDEDVWLYLKEKAYLFAHRNNVNKQRIEIWLNDLQQVIRRPHEFDAILPKLLDTI